MSIEEQIARWYSDNYTENHYELGLFDKFLISILIRFYNEFMGVENERN